MWFLVSTANVSDFEAFGVSHFEIKNAQPRLSWTVLGEVKTKGKDTKIFRERLQTLLSKVVSLKLQLMRTIVKTFEVLF